MLATEEPNYISSLSSKYYSVSINSRAFSASERDWIESHDVLRVGYLEDYLPYSDTDRNGKVTGMISEMIPAMLKELNLQNITVTFKGYRSYDDATSGRPGLPSAAPRCPVPILRARTSTWWRRGPRTPGT